MKRQSFFLGMILILLAVLFSLKALGVQVMGEEIDILGFFWPIFLLVLGAWIISSVFFAKGFVEDSEGATIDLQGAKEAKVEFHHGAGQIKITSGAPANQLLTANKGTGISVSSQLIGERIEAKIDSGPTFIPFLGPESGEWRIHLNQDISLVLDVDAGAAQVTLDLADLKVTRLKLQTGASNVKITTPRGIANSLIDISAGAASVDVIVPDQVAARIRIKEGFSSLQVDKDRFPAIDNTLYQSANYDQAANRVELTFETGVGSINVH